LLTRSGTDCGATDNRSQRCLTHGRRFGSSSDGCSAGDRLLLLRTQVAKRILSRLNGTRCSPLNIISQITARLLHVNIKRARDWLIEQVCGLIAWCRRACVLTHPSSEVLNRICLALESTHITPEVSDTAEDPGCCVASSPQRVITFACDAPDLLCEIANNVCLTLCLLLFELLLTELIDSRHRLGLFVLKLLL
jgi:hypothetical protein